MKSFDELEKYKLEIEAYELNSEWVDDIKDAILSLKNPKEIVLSCLIDQYGEFYYEMMRAKKVLLNKGFGEDDIRRLCFEYYDKYVE